MNPHNPHAEAQRQLFGMLHRLRGFFPATGSLLPARHAVRATPAFARAGSGDLPPRSYSVTPAKAETANPLSASKAVLSIHT